MALEQHVLAALVAAVAPGLVGVSAQGMPSDRPVVVKVSDGFDWLDAGIGAAAAVAVVLLVVGLALSVRQASGGR
jgi:hypothetical protein